MTPAGPLRNLPQVDRLLRDPAWQSLLALHGRAETTRVVRTVLAELRTGARNGSSASDAHEPAAILEAVTAALGARAQFYYRRVVNATGVVLHTGLGRAPLPPRVAERLADLVQHPLRVEIDLTSGQRGGRDRGCTELLTELTGCADATVVNNNAGATLLILAALARGREVILSRGEMVEIGGSYRVPEILAESGAHLVEVGTTNRTHLHDYERALTERTGMILKVHTSNYRVEGFTHEVPIDELVALGHAHQVAVVHDLGSGCLVDLGRLGVPGEPYVPHSVATGADLVCFSGDKLLGGPQCGIILGQHEAVERCRRHPLFRALRPGRLTYVALEQTLRIYREGQDAVLTGIPALGRLLAEPEELRRRAQRLARRLGQALTPTQAERLRIDVVEVASQAGSGSLPTQDLPSAAVRVHAATGGAGDLAEHLRAHDPPVLARLQDGAVLLDVRTLADDEFPLIAAALRKA